MHEHGVVMKTVKVLWWGLNGVCYDFQQEGCGNCSCTTYKTPEYFFSHMEDRDKNEIFTGAWVIDKSKILENNPTLSIKSPLVDVNADPDSYEKSFNKWEKYTGTETITGWTYVGVNVYVEWWRSRGARIGRMIDEKSMIWEIKNTKIKYKRKIRIENNHVIAYYIRQYRSAYDPSVWEEDEALNDLKINPPENIPLTANWIEQHYETSWSWRYEVPQ